MQWRISKLFVFWNHHWLWNRHCATSRKVAGSILNVVTGIFHWHNLSGHTMSQGLTRPLTGMSTRNISWGVKAAGAQGWQRHHLYVLIVLESASLTLLELSGPVQTCNGVALPFTTWILIHIKSKRGEASPCRWCRGLSPFTLSVQQLPSCCWLQ